MSTRIEVTFPDRVRKILESKTREEKKEWLKDALVLEVDTMFEILTTALTEDEEIALNLEIKRIEE